MQLKATDPNRTENWRAAYIPMSEGCTTNLWTGAPAWTQPNFCASLYASGLAKPRGLHIDKSTDEILLVDRGKSGQSNILSGWSEPKVIRLDNDGATVTVAEGVSGLNHGIELANGYLYASTPTTVYRWPYETGQMYPGNADNAQEVIVGMDRNASDELGAPGGHTTRTLAFDSEKKWLYVSIGSLGNVDSDSFRSRIRRFDISSWNGSTQPLNFNEGEVFADGLRNEVGLAFDSHGDLWGVENGADRLYRSDLGGDIHNDNPAEELNRFREDQAGQHWGYPYCWSEYCLPIENGGSGMKGANTQWAWPSMIDAGYTDEWCRENTNPSVMSMPGHSAPLGVTFYDWTPMSQEEYNNSGCTGGFPKSMDKYAFIAFHGSWNRSPPTGYKVVFVPFDNQGNPTALPIDLMRHDGDSAAWPDAVRPVDVQFDSCGRLYVTEDGTGSVIKITYGGGYLDEFVPIETDVADGGSCTPFQSPPTKLPTSSPSVATLKKPSVEPVEPPLSPPPSDQVLVGSTANPSVDPVKPLIPSPPSAQVPLGSTADPTMKPDPTLKPINGCCPASGSESSAMNSRTFGRILLLGFILAQLAQRL